VCELKGSGTFFDSTACGASRLNALRPHIEKMYRTPLAGLRNHTIMSILRDSTMKREKNILLWILLAVTASVAGAVERHVPDPYPTIQAAINDANDGDHVVIAPGTYTGPGNRDIDFLGKAITVRSTNPADEAVVEATIIDGQDLYRGFILQNGEDANSVIAGLTITRGYGFYGGGIECQDAGPTIERCRMIHCSFTNYFGGSIYVGYSAATVRHCAFTGNSRCALYCYRCDHLTVEDCVFEGESKAVTANSAGLVQLIRCTFRDSPVGVATRSCRTILTECCFERSGSAYCVLSERDRQLTVTRCTFIGNSKLPPPNPAQGTAIRVTSTPFVRLAQCLFLVGNFTRAVYGEYADMGLQVDNCTFVGNRAGSGPAIGLDSSRCRIRNSILWDGGHEIELRPESEVEITYSNVFGGWPGVGNIVVDPCFVDPGHWEDNGTPDYPYDDIWVNGDYHLKSQAGRWDAAAAQWVLDDVTSPCIDAGDPMIFPLLEPWPDGGRINMGVYGGTAEASRSFFGAPLCQVRIPGDLNGDCKIDMADLALMAANWTAAVSFQATDPQPPDGGSTDNFTLTWQSGHGALSHDVYFGSDFEAVQDATHESPTYRGSVPTPLVSCYEFMKPWPTTPQDYFWRVDEVYPTMTIKGAVWRFSRNGGPR